METAVHMQISSNDMSFNSQVSDSVNLNPAEEVLKGTVVYCKRCGDRRGQFHDGKFYRGVCKCQADAIAENERRLQAKLRAEQKRQAVQVAKAESLLLLRYKNVSFEDTEIVSQEFENVLQRMKKYCSNPQKRLDEGQGFYIYGKSTGSGKSHLTACVCNDLIEKGYSVMFTNFIEIANKIKETYAKKTLMTELEIINKVAGFDFLIIDDFGTEQFKKTADDTFYQEKVYDILNRRYNKKLPTIFSSNLSLQELIEERGVSPKTVDRVMEMSRVVFRLEGASYRRKLRSEDVDF